MNAASAEIGVRETFFRGLYQLRTISESEEKWSESAVINAKTSTGKKTALKELDFSQLDSSLSVQTQKEKGKDWVDADLVHLRRCWDTAAEALTLENTHTVATWICDLIKSFGRTTNRAGELMDREVMRSLSAKYSSLGCRALKPC